MDALEGYAFGQSPEKVHQRVAGDSSEIYLDMADPDNRVIRISGGKWEIAYESPYKFRRTELTAPLPEPKRGGEIDRLWKHVNVFPEDRGVLIGVAIDALIRPNTAKPILIFHGEHGSAKTATAKRFRSLVDPSSADMHLPPRDVGQLLVKAAGGWLMAFDNVSSLSSDVSDILCALATGAGVTDRTLYTNFDLSVLKFRRSIMLTTIHLDRLRGDFADRVVSIKQPVIDGRTITRETEEDLDSQWPEDWPVILGALLDQAANVQQKLRTLGRQKNPPRMADFAKILVAYDELFGTESLERYREQLMSGLVASIDGDVFTQHLIACRYSTDDSGRASKDILEDIEKRFPELQLTKPKGWPPSPRTVTGILRRQAPSLRQMGWKIEDDEGKNKGNSVRFVIRPPKAADGGESTS
ncbi:hypothetical protein C3476_22885 [Mycobacterium kansasii]|nr:hypothetical protein C3B43_20290 [Mycobacterium kansasii]POY16407.1 hypothetical protein C3476_22885 [Mycobacterium kansasii]